MLNQKSMNRSIQYLSLNSAIFYNTMPKRVQSEIRKRIEASGEPHRIQQLCLDGIQIKTITLNIKRLLESCFNIEYLTVNDCELRSLENFPALKNLIGLELSDNLLTGEDLSKLAPCHQINFLNLENNRISSLTHLNHLKRLPDLEIIEIHDNEICEEDNYRGAIFSMFPKVNIIDCYDRQGNKVEEEDPSEYISNIEHSRLDLLDLLEDAEDEQNDEFLKTAVGYLEDGIIKRRDSLDTSPSPQPNFLDFTRSSAQRVQFQQKGIMFMRTGLVEDSSDDQNSDLIRDFKRKMHKKQE